MTITAWCRDFWQRRCNDCVAIFGIALFFLACFWPLFVRGKFFVTADAFIEMYPLRTVVWNSIRHGQAPLWTPYIFSGYPLLSMGQNGVGYPLTWQYLFLPGWYAEQIFVLAPFVLFPCFTYAYVREIGRSRMASFIAALTFGASGAMFNALSYNGLHPNSLMWFPLLLIALERARTGRFINCLLGAIAAYSMSVLSGYGQGFVIAGVIASVYAVYLGLVARRLVDQEQKPAITWISWKRWQPLVVTICAIATSAGLGAFQILESSRAHKRSIRHTLTYELFVSNAFTFKQAFQSFFTPLHHIIDTTAYVAPVCLLLAVIGTWTTIRRQDARGIFWLVTAVFTFLLMTGGETPIFRVLFYVPVLNLFRAPARHGYEYIFGLAVLSAYGWDAVTARTETFTRPIGRAIAITIPVLFAIGIAVAIIWCLELQRVPIAVMEWFYQPPPYPESRYVLWKALFAIPTIALLFMVSSIGGGTRRAMATALVIGLACFVEPALFASRFWWPTLKPASRFSEVSPITGFLQQFPPHENRIYTRTSLWWEERSPHPRLETANLNMLRGLQNVAGYEPLILERYSRALGNAFLDGVSPRPGYPSDTSILERRSHVLDLLNTKFLISYFDFATEPYTPAEKDGIKFADRDLSINLQPGESAIVGGAATEADTLAIGSTLSYGADVADGEVVARARLIKADGRVIEKDIIAGRDTAEWAHDRPDLRGVIRHHLAQILDDHPGDSAQSWTAHRYFARINFGERLQVERVEFTNVARKAGFHVVKATLFDSTRQHSMTLPYFDLTKWEPVYDRDNVLIVRNKFTLPRCWLVAEAEAVDGEEALRRIRGESSQPFDPLRTALLEIRPENLPALPGGPISPESTAKIVSYGDNRIEIATTAPAPTVLVLSEINYPGWVATLDGVIAPIHATNYLLRGMFVPAGAHKIEMHYAAPGARYGAMISVVTVLLVIGLGVAARRGRRHAKEGRAHNG